MGAIASPPPEPAVLEVLQDGGCWRIRSTDGLFSGLFLDRRSACRQAEAEAESHPGHIVIIRAP